MIHKVTGYLALLALASGLSAAEITLDGCRSTENWSSFNGSEFKGAQVKLDASPEGLLLSYDFSEGGAYVGCQLRKFSVQQADSFTVTVKSTEEAAFNYRIVDSTGRVFQGRGFKLPKNKEETLTLSVKGPWSTAWGGDKDQKQPLFPLKSVWLMATKGKDLPAAGVITLRSFKAQVTELPATSVKGEDFTAVLSGWQVKGEWQPQLEGAMLKIRAEGKTPAQLELVFPRAGRDLVQRYQLKPGNANEFFYKVPFAGLVNPRNRYSITLRVTGAGEQAEYRTLLQGALAGTVNFGDPRSSREITASQFGTCVHFSYAPKPEGAFKGWHPQEMLLDEIAACGFKYIREGLKLEKQPDGSWKISDYGTSTLKLAKERGIEQIVVIDMYADDTLEEFLAKVRAIVEGSRSLVNVYELGNEPHNFGKWRQKYTHNGKPGNWNGYESDGSISEWLKQHTRYTNAAADLIKQLDPSKTVIGLGSCAPTNFHALNLGVSKNLDGVVEHPYGFSLPAEKVPYGWSLAKRDGIRVGDEENTFRGLVDSYHEHFRKTGQKRSLWITEFGFSSYWFNREKKMYAGYSEEAQALYLLRRFIESLALPVAISLQYDFLDDYDSSPNMDEANFGLLRSDYSRKPAYDVLQRMNSLLAGAEFAPALKAKVTDDSLHRAAIRSELVRDWDEAKITAANGIRIYGFSHPEAPNERLVAVWSMQPYSREFNNRVVSFEVEGLAEFTATPIAIDLITGATYDIPVEFKERKATVTDLPLKDNVILFKFFKK